MPTHYLYGASVNSIQKFITETGKLKEIVGGSEWVEAICTDKFKELIEQIGPDKFQKDQLILSAAGKIHYLFKDKSICEKVVKSFPKSIIQLTPNIQFSQAVIPVNDSLKENHFQQLFTALKSQRNRQASTYSKGLMIANRSRRTGRPACVHNQYNETFIDTTQDKKLIESKGKRLISKFSNGNFPTEMEQITQQKEWLAILHADGNSMGKTIQDLYKELSNGKDHTLLSSFSQALDKATKEAANKAFKEVVPLDKNNTYPMRPIVLGGDDLTIIIRGDLAINFAAAFLKYFEINTKEAFKKLDLPFLNNGFTACAGIAYIKSNYPIHYGVDLAEKLTKHAKTVAKEIQRKTQSQTIPSCLVFHKVQSSFVESIKEIFERELSTGKEDNRIGFDYGPYFLERQEGYSTIEQLQFWVRKVKQEDAPKSNIRNWLTELHINQDIAQQSLRRIIDTSKKDRYVKWLELDTPFKHREKIAAAGEEKVTHLQDVLTLASIG